MDHLIPQFPITPNDKLDITPGRVKTYTYHLDLHATDRFVTKHGLGFYYQHMLSDVTKSHHPNKFLPILIRLVSYMFVFSMQNTHCLLLHTPIRIRQQLHM